MNTSVTDAAFFAANNPCTIFNAWYEEAQIVIAHEPTSMTLSTVDQSGKPPSRVVLLKEHDRNGFVFYTNLMSRKGRDIQKNRHVALNLYWPLLARQVRIVGVAGSVTDQEADAYFATRPRDSQIAAWASSQSSILPDRADFETKRAEYAAQFEGRPISRPDFWSGFRVEPSSIEF